MHLTISIPGATPPEIERGVAAAQAMFDHYGVTPLRVSEARFAVEGEKISHGAGQAEDEDWTLFHIWYKADSAARAACCSGWAYDRVPDSAMLELHAVPRRQVSVRERLEDVAGDLAYFVRRAAAVFDRVPRHGVGAPAARRSSASLAPRFMPRRAARWLDHRINSSVIGKRCLRHRLRC